MPTWTVCPRGDVFRILCVGWTYISNSMPDAVMRVSFTSLQANARAIQGKNFRAGGGFKNDNSAERRIQTKIRHGGNTPIPLHLLRQRLKRFHVSGEIGDGGW